MPQSYTILPRLRTDRIPAEQRKPTDKYPLLLIVTIKRERYPVNLGRKLTLAEWDVNARKAKGPQATVINAVIAKRLAEFTSLLDEAERTAEAGLTMAHFRKVLERKPVEKIAIADYFDKYMIGDKAFHARRRESTLKRIRNAFSRIYRHMPPDICFEDVQPQHLVAWFDAMQRTGAKNNTALKSMTVLRQIFNHAKDRGVTKSFPFAGYRTPAYQKVLKPYLTIQQCDLLLNKLEEAGTKEEPYTTLGFFLLECFTGLRQSDWNTWQIDRDRGGGGKTFLRLRMSKKTGEPVRLPLNHSPRLSRVIGWIEKHHPTHKYPYTQQHANRTLAKTMAEWGLDAAIRTHSGRHTCATLLLDKGFSREAVAEVLGVTIKVVDTYAKLSRQKVQLEYERHGGL